MNQEKPRQHDRLREAAKRTERARVLDRLQQAVIALRVFAEIVGDEEDAELHRLALEALADLINLRARVGEAFEAREYAPASAQKDPK